jgi:uncharacterized protein (DUF2252 family)
MLDITTATTQYEAWLMAHLPAPMVPDDIALKHRRMADDPFAFLRAAYYRWAQVWPAVCTQLAVAPTVLAVGDLHVENFGTWRDAEGRLIWGVNDFDECYALPYTNDLVRLTMSAMLAHGAGQLALSPQKACAAILEGYHAGLQADGTPFVLAEYYGDLRKLALNHLRDPEPFWRKLQQLPDASGAMPASARNALERCLPQRGQPYRLVHRVAGAGSLGRERLVALAQWDGGLVARETKALLPSAWI